MKNPKQEILHVLKENYSEYNSSEIFLFWSRVRWDYKKNSDYDIWIRWTQKLSFFELMELREQLSELPYLIDLVDFHSVSPEFSKIALKNTEKWK